MFDTVRAAIARSREDDSLEDRLQRVRLARLEQERVLALLQEEVSARQAALEAKTITPQGLS
jgi:hypothetical protein